jgi:SAM-dependent methyltransferase
MPAAQEPHDVVAYPGYSYPNTHPDRLAVMGMLHGLTPAPVERCRVLEVACGDGANLVPMAYAIPSGEFVGFDLAHEPVKRGQERIRELGLTNARIFQSNLLEVGTELGEFDYIIAHGFYSWVPPQVADHLLALCEKLLALQGIAFVSYCALPGSYLRLMLRDMMLFRARGIQDPEQQVLAGLDSMHFLVAARPEGDPHRVLIEEQLKRMESHSLAATYHDEFCANYHPVHFIDFVHRAEKHGLQYLGEPVLPPPPDPGYRADLRAPLESAYTGDTLQQEQMLDFIRVRSYRESLLCKAGLPVRSDFAVERFREFLLASQTSSEPGKEPGSTAFVLPGGIRMESNHPAVVRLLEELSKVWPRAMSFSEIASRLAEVGFSLDGDGAALLVRLAVSKMMELRAWRVPVADAISERPRASACTRQEGRQGKIATTLLHSTISVEDPKVRSLLQLLDGTRNRMELLGAMVSEFPAIPPAEIEEGLDPNLRMLYAAGVLEA